MYSILDFDFHDKIFNRMVACRKRSKPERWSGADRDREGYYCFPLARAAGFR